METKIRNFVIGATVAFAMLYLAFSVDSIDRKFEKQQLEIKKLELRVDDLAQAYTTKDRELENGLAQNYQEIMTKIDELNEKLN